MHRPGNASVRLERRVLVSGGPPGPPSVEPGQSSPDVVGLEQLSSSPDLGDGVGVCSVDHRDRSVPREGFRKIIQAWIEGMARQAHVR
jgi:hypothetical protein